MARDTHIPLVFWIAAAALAHVLWAGGTDRIIVLLERRMQLFEFLVRVDAQAEAANRPMEVTLEAATPEPEPAPPPPEPRVAVRPPKPKAEPAVEPPRPRPTPPKPTKPREKPAPELAILVPPKPPPAKSKPLEQPDEQNRRISVRQHVKDKNQKPNPDAEFLGKYANRVEEQTQARITSTDRDDPQPTPGSSHAGPIEFPGNSDQTRVAQSEDKAGTPDLAPDPVSGTTREQPNPEAAAASEAARQRARSSPAPKVEAGRPPTPEQRAQAAASRTLTSERGSVALGADRSQRSQQAVQGRPRTRRRRVDPLDMLGLGSQGTTSRGINLNLTPQAAVAAVGQDALVRERRRDAERRLSEHRGSWKSLGLERWRSAIENYVPSVKLGSQTALNTAAAPFAEYLNQIHNRIHPIFADTFLASLDRLPSDHPMSDLELKTFLELVLSEADGRIVRMGVTRTSGVTAFDIGALESVQKASPFGPPPPEIVSPDGNVYLHWEFHRRPWYACSTYFARPYILKGRPGNAPAKIGPPPELENKERPPSEPRRGGLFPKAAPRWAVLLSDPSR
jgi:outer membrane biosynthesis protein TonB